MPSVLPPPSSRMRSVACEPGAAVLMVMPSANTSWAAVLIHAHSAVRATFDMANVGMGCFTEDDVMQQIRPHFLAHMCGAASRTKRIDVVKLALRAAANCWSSNSKASVGGGPPAFGTRM